MDQKTFFEHVNIRDGFFLFNYPDCKNNYEKEFYENLAKKFESTYRFYNKILTNFV